MMCKIDELFVDLLFLLKQCVAKVVRIAVEFIKENCITADNLSEQA